MTLNPLVAMQQLGQSPWHDNIRRELLTSGKLAQMVADGDITGLTSNPTIFEQAIANNTDYDEALARLARAGRTPDAIFDQLSIEDIQGAADVFRPVFDRTQGADGYVSIEVRPNFANNTAATVAEAQRLWAAVNRPNLMVKIPATLEGLPAIQQSIAAGVNINVTLIFSLERYEAVMEAYLAGLEQRAAAGQPIGRLASVASFFVSRVDTLVDKLLEARIQAVGGAETEAGRPFAALRGQAAIANAKLAYGRFLARFGSERWAALEAKGARKQRPLWASTSTKNPAYPDIYYVEALIGPDTVDTLPPATILAYKDHGRPQARLAAGLEEAARTIEQLEAFGIRMAEVTHKLEVDGVASFTKSFETLMQVVAARRAAVLAGDRQALTLPAGPLRAAVRAAQAALTQAEFGKRLWKKDSTLWKPDAPAHQAEIRIRLGWLDVFTTMQGRLDEMTACAQAAQRAGFTHALLCGMGGSSLAPEVLRETFGLAPGYLDLAVLDSTDPAAVLAAEARSDPARTLYIIASKSGSTTEPNAFFKYFWEKVKALKGDQAGDNFIAITDPGTAMERTAAEHRFRKVFLNPPEIGGRYSALSFFGLAPAALMGIDVARLLAGAAEMAQACGAGVPALQNPGLTLGAALGALAQAGRDKLTFLMPPALSTVGYWIEHLIAESTGKEGVGILPVEGERPAAPPAYGRDRVFVSLKLAGARANATDRAAAALAAARQPVIRITLPDRYALGGEFLKWEIATAAAGWVLSIDPFDQPNVQESKDNTVRLLDTWQAQGALPDPGGALSAAAPDFAAQLVKHLARARRGDYVALTAYIERTPAREKLLRDLQAAVRDRTGRAVTIGYGPRFLHSTGQLHKGGANTGVFVQFTAHDPQDAPVPGEPYSFSVRTQAQALGDYEALLTHQRRALRVALGDNIEGGLRKALAAVRTPAAPAKKAAKKAGAKNVPNKKSAKPAPNKKTASKKGAKRPAKPKANGKPTRQPAKVGR
ncbi:MAG: bifunctional transaldolase/phosoglucose isomerase [Anaerolineales bacterium]|nr:bifunctional transaldolase/phosoglucose isomerase [Anaerolineales bacterium]